MSDSEFSRGTSLSVKRLGVEQCVYDCVFIHAHAVCVCVYACVHMCARLCVCGVCVCVGG